MADFCRQCGVPLLVKSNAEALCEDCFNLQEHPDPLSTQKQIAGVPMQDLKATEENDRIVKISEALKQNPGKVIGVMVDYGPLYQGKGDRYIEKLSRILPDAKVVARFLGPVNGVETISFKL